MTPRDAREAHTGFPQLETPPREVRSEIESLGRRYGAPTQVVHSLENTSFGPLNRSREAEVAMAIRRPSGRVLLQTKRNYPDVFRLPTGGLKSREPIETALLRETREETALDVEVRRFVAVLTYQDASRRQLFTSYLFLLDETGGTLQEQDPEEGITGWIEADVAGLADATRRLRACPGIWRHWGHFRALVIDELLPALEG